MLDLARGTAVHARTGDRERYEPVQSVLAPGGDGDPVALLRAYRETLGATACYVADLDAIQGGAIQRGVLRELATWRPAFPARCSSTRAPIARRGAGSAGLRREPDRRRARELHAFADLAASWSWSARRG